MDLCSRCQVNPAVKDACCIRVCELCSAQLDAEPLPLLGHPSEAPSQWTCSCGSQFYRNEDMCTYCGYVRLELVQELSEVESVPMKTQVNECTPLPNPYFTCQMCGYDYNLSATCSKCGNKPQLPPQPLLTSTLPNPCWTCPACSYEYNTEKTCSRCSTARPGTEAVQPISWTCPTCHSPSTVPGSCAYCQASVHLPAAVPPQPTSQWQCSRCGQGNSTQSQTCFKCQWAPSFSPPQPSQVCGRCGQQCGGQCAPPRPALCSTCSQPLPASGGCSHCESKTLSKSTRETRWKCRYCGDAYQTERTCNNCRHKKDDGNWNCFGCGNSNADGHSACLSCHASKELNLYLVSRGVPVSSSQREWKCKHCEGVTPVHLPTCGKCGKENETVRKALEFKGNKLGFFERLGGMF